MLLYGKKGKTMDFSETIVVCDIKVGRRSQLNDFNFTSNLRMIKAWYWLYHSCKFAICHSMATSNLYKTLKI